MLYVVEKYNIIKIGIFLPTYTLTCVIVGFLSTFCAPTVVFYLSCFRSSSRSPSRFFPFYVIFVFFLLLFVYIKSCQIVSDVRAKLAPRLSLPRTFFRVSFENYRCKRRENTWCLRDATLSKIIKFMEQISSSCN